MTVIAGAHDASRALASDSHAAVILGITSPLLLVSCILFLAQLYLRLRSVYLGYYRLGWDDSFLILAAVFSVIAYAFLVVAIVHGLDSRPKLTQHAKNQISLWISVSSPLWIWSSVWAKISLAVTIMRVKVSPLSRALMTAFLILVPVTTFALWLPTVVHRDSSDTAMRWQIDHGLYLGVALIFLLADLILTVPPTLFLFSKRPLVEMMIAGFLCFLGVCAVGCSIGRVVLQAQNYEHTTVTNFQASSVSSNVVPFIILVAAEALVSIIAACTPTIFHFSAKAMHLIPAAYRDQLIRKKSTLQSRRDNTTPEVDATLQKPPNVMDRYSRDLGLDALPDNPRFSTVPRMRRSWLSWRHSAAFASTNRITLDSTEEAPNENAINADREVETIRETSAVPNCQLSAGIRITPLNSAAENPPALTGRDSSRHSKSMARRSLWAPWTRSSISDLSMAERRRSSSLAAWLQWETSRNERNSAIEPSATGEDRQAEQTRSYADQTQILSLDQPSEKSKGNAHRRSESKGVSLDDSASQSPVAFADEKPSPKPSDNSAEHLEPRDFSMTQPPTQTTNGHGPDESRPLSWESAQHQYFEPQLSASLEEPPEFSWGAFEAEAAAHEQQLLAEEHANGWPLSNQRLDSIASVESVPHVLTVRNL